MENKSKNKMAIEMENVFSLFKGPNGTVFAIIFAIVIVLLTIVVAWIIGRSRNKRNTVLFIGLSDGGKTLLFTRLHHGKFISTHTSIKENRGSYAPKQTQDGKVLELIDVPGNEKLRGKFIDQFKDLARGIIFVVDSVNFTRELHAVAECLYDILSNKTFNKLSPQLLIACNKQDLTTAKSMNVIKSQLAKEISPTWRYFDEHVRFLSNTLRKTRAAAVKGLDEQSMSRDQVFVGQKGKDFDFTDLRGIKVEFIECSLKGDADSDLKPVHEWLNNLM